MPSATSSKKSASRAPDVLSELLSSRVRSAVLSFMVAREEDRFSLTELARVLELSISSVQHECYKLERLGVIKGQREGASRRYWLNRETPFVPVLMWLVVSVIGEAQIMHYALRDVPGLEAAMLLPGARPVAVLIGDVDLQAIAEVQERVAKILQRHPTEIDVALYDASTWEHYVRTGHPMVVRLLTEKPWLLKGSLPKRPTT